MSKLGTELEQLVKAIQKTLKDSPHISIRTNVKLEDTNGIKREIDVLIEDFNVSPCCRIAFECKDYKKKVDIQIVDAVIGKFLDIPDIRKIIIVSTEGYTVSAKKKARKHNIELCTFSKVSLDHILLNSTPVLSTTMKTEVLDVYFEVDVLGTNIIHISDTTENIDAFLKLFINNPPVFDNIKLQELGYRFAENNLNPIEDVLALEILYPLYINGKNGERFKLKTVLFNVKISIDVLEGKLQEQRITKNGSDEIISAKYEVNDSYSMVTIKTSNNISTYLETEDKHLHEPLLIGNDSNN